MLGRKMEELSVSNEIEDGSVLPIEIESSSSNGTKNSELNITGSLELWKPFSIQQA
jgi:hypothetical protein